MQKWGWSARVGEKTKALRGEEGEARSGEVAGQGGPGTAMRYMAERAAASSSSRCPSTTPGLGQNPYSPPHKGPSTPHACQWMPFPPHCHTGLAWAERGGSVAGTSPGLLRGQE